MENTPLLHPLRRTSIDPHSNDVPYTPLPYTELTITDWKFLLDNHMSYLNNIDENLKDKEEIDTYLRITTNILEQLLKFWKDFQAGCEYGYENVINDINWDGNTKKILKDLNICAELSRRNHFAGDIIRSLKHILSDIASEMDE